MFCLHYWYFIFIFGRMKKTKGVCVFCLNDWCKKWWYCIHHEFKWLRRALICFWIWFKSHCMILLFVHSLSSFNNETAGRDVRRFVICICVSIIVVSRACIRDDSLGLPKTLLILWHEEPNKWRKRSDNKMEKKTEMETREVEYMHLNPCLASLLSCTVSLFTTSTEERYEVAFASSSFVFQDMKKDKTNTANESCAGETRCLLYNNIHWMYRVLCCSSSLFSLTLLSFLTLLSLDN